MIIDARELDPGAELRADVCIVGAGAAGLTVAAALADSPYDVCVLESGGFRPEAETQQLYDLECAGYPIRPDFMSRARYYGGSCNLWAGRSMCLSALDVSGRSWVPSSAWPIGYAELASYYPAAARILELPSIECFDPGSHAAHLSAVERALFGAEPLVPTVSLWARRPKRFGRAYRSLFQRPSGMRLVHHANVTRIQLDPAGRAVESLEVTTDAGQRLAVRARIYVLACGGLENARLLLVSRDVHPAGVGNGYDVVGRYFMDHPRAVYGRVRLSEAGRLELLRGRPLRDGKVQLGIGLSPEIQREEGLLNHYATLEAEVSGYTEAGYQSFVRTMKVLLRRGYAGRRRDLGRARLGDVPGLIYLLTPKELLPHPVYRALTLVRRGLERRTAGGSRVVVYFCEQPPDPESRVTLSRERDRLGMNRLVLHWRISPEVTRTVLRLQELLRVRLREAGIGEIQSPDEEVRFTDASHHMGTTRMSTSPRTGVVDPDCRVHGVANLFIAGSSVFPSAGHANPTLTIVALALRLADRIRNGAG